jgi:hypothetical protein
VLILSHAGFERHFSARTGYQTQLSLIRGNSASGRVLSPDTSPGTYPPKLLSLVGTSERAQGARCWGTPGLLAGAELRGNYSVARAGTLASARGQCMGEERRNGVKFWCPAGGRHAANKISSCA